MTSKLTFRQKFRTTINSLETHNFFIPRNVLDYLEKLAETTSWMNRSFPHTSLETREHQYACLHAYQLYSEQTVSKFSQNYQWNANAYREIARLIGKGLQSYHLIPSFLPLAKNSLEHQKIQNYSDQLLHHLSSTLACGVKEIESWKQKPLTALVHRLTEMQWNPTKNDSFRHRQSNLLCDSGYFMYLILRNRCFMDYLKKIYQSPQIQTWMEEYIESHGVLEEQFQSVEEALYWMNFSEMEAFVQNTTRQLLSDEKEWQGFAQHLSNEDAFILTVSEEVAIAQMEPTLIAEVAPYSNVERDFFEKLSFWYAKELIALSRHMYLVKDCSSPYYRAKNEDYHTKAQEGYQKLLGNNAEIYDEIGDLFSTLLQSFIVENPFSIQREKIIIEREEGEPPKLLERGKEWMILLGTKLPYSLRMEHQGYSRTIEKGHKVIFQLGVACFDYDQVAKVKLHTKPGAYVKILVHGYRLQDHDSIVYCEGEAYSSFTLPQIQQCQNLLFLFLISLRNQCSLRFSHVLQRFLFSVLAGYKQNSK